MSARRGAIGEAIHLSALGIWLGAVVMVGATAASAFPVMKELQPQLPEFSSVPADNWSIAAGQVMFRAFFICDLIQFVCAMVAIVSFLLVFVRLRTGPGAALRGVRLLVMTSLMALLAYYMIALTPAMNEAMQAYWSAAKIGDLEVAAENKRVFDELHPKASAALRINAILVLLAIILAVVNARSGGGPADAQTPPRAPSTPPTDSRPEEPMLARGIR